MEPDRPEKALYHDEVFRELRAVQVEQLQALMKSGRQPVSLLPLRQLLGLPCPPAGIRDELSIDIVDRDAQPPCHAAAPGERKLEDRSELRWYPSLVEVRMLHLRELEAKRLVARRLLI